MTQIAQARNEAIAIAKELKEHANSRHLDFHAALRSRRSILASLHHPIRYYTADPLLQGAR
jgi:hypothetical protein